MKRIMFAAMILGLCLTGCAAPAVDTSTTDESVSQSSPQAPATYTQITQEAAKEMMDAGDVLILDVRREEEYDAGHIYGAVLLPLDEISEWSASVLIPHKDFTVLVYCRSGNRSKQASEALVNLGYTSVYEFGGINTWPHEIVKTEIAEG